MSQFSGSPFKCDLTLGYSFACECEWGLYPYNYPFACQYPFNFNLTFLETFTKQKNEWK